MIVDPDFCDHWKTRMLVGLLDGDEAAPVYVIRLWAHCQNRRQDTFENLTAQSLKALCRYSGHANKLENGLVTSGFVRRENGLLIVCNWSEYNASLIASWANGSKGRGSGKDRPDSYREADPDMTSTQWNSRRMAVIERDGGVCQYCQAKMPGGCVVDHILPVSSGGTNDLENLCVACRQCNTSKQDKIIGQWRPANPTTRISRLLTGAPTGAPTGAGVEKSREEKIEEHSPTPPRESDDPPIVKKSKALKTALAFWNQYWIETHGEGRPESPTKIEGMLSRAMSAGWSEEKIIESIRASVGWGAKSWRDPDVNFDEQAKAKANGKKQPIPESERC